jgi:hypothetical protein
VRRAVVRGENDVEVAVIIEIGEGGAARDFGSNEIGPHQVSGIFKIGAAIQKKMGRLFVERAGTYIPRRIVDVPIDYQKVEQSIEIGVEKEAAEAEGVPGQPAYSR